jgi:hypothetical protein
MQMSANMHCKTTWSHGTLGYAFCIDRLDANLAQLLFSACASHASPFIHNLAMAAVAAPTNVPARVLFSLQLPIHHQRVHLYIFLLYNNEFFLNEEYTGDASRKAMKSSACEDACNT